MSPLNDAQTTMLKSYGAGDYAWIAEDFPEEHTLALDAVERQGDTLLLFLFRELSDREGCQDMNTAITQVLIAIDDLEGVLQELQELEKEEGCTQYS